MMNLLAVERAPPCCLPLELKYTVSTTIMLNVYLLNIMLELQTSLPADLSEIQEEFQIILIGSLSKMGTITAQHLFFC